MAGGSWDGGSLWDGDRRWMVFDVESAGLHGGGFAVGWVVVSQDEGELDAGIAVSRSHDPLPQWVVENVLPNLPPATHETEEEVRSQFWRTWEYWRERGALLVADVAWPVEANFLTACIAEGRGRREANGPYPLVDVASVRLGAGFDPLADEDRLPDELPEHDPLADARHSARLLMEALD